MTTTTETETTTAAPSRRGFIPEIQGLRTIALLLVATFHVWLDRVSGGVDVFLLISAYLMTRSLADRAERGSVTQPFSFLVKKFARLLPIAVATILLTLGAALLLLPENLWAGFAGDAVASVAYVENVRLQELAVDYFAANDALASPFQHFWSLSIQGQVFVIWAIVHLLCDLLARATRWPIRRILLVVFGLVFAGSLAYSVWLTGSNQTLAYFDTWARLWEFAAGSLLAVVHPWMRLPNWLRHVFVALGVAGVLSCGVLLPVASSFPGYAALWPVASAGLVILASGRENPVGAGRFLALPVLTRIGDYTYALYLTHWPVLVITLFVTQQDQAGARLGFLILGISAVLSIILVHAVEKPLARWNARRVQHEAAGPASAPADAAASSSSTSAPVREVDRRSERRKRARKPYPVWRGITTIIVSAGLVVGAMFAIEAVVNRIQQENEQAIANANYAKLGANAPVGTTGTPLQEVALVKDDWVNPGPKCAEDDPYRTALCYHILSETGSAERSILNIGNSHSTQLTGALLEVIERRPNWELRTSVTPGCDYGSAIKPTATGECKLVWKNAERFIAEKHPDLVFIFGTVGQTMAPDTRLDPVLDWVARMKSASPDTTIVVMRDNPRLDRSPFDCAVQSSYDSPECVAQFIPSDQTAFANRVTEVGGVWVDINEAICDKSQCPPVRGNVFVWLDTNHITDTYQRTLAGPLSEQVHAALEWWPQDPYGGERLDRTPGQDGIQDQLNK